MGKRIIVFLLVTFFVFSFPVYAGEEVTEEDIEEEEYWDSLEALAILVMGEAEGEPEDGKRLVIDTVLNRVDSDKFPDNLWDVIYQKNQYVCMFNGRSERVVPTEEVFSMVLEELENRTNSEVLFFRTGHYGCGTPLFKVGHHYLSK